MKYLATNGYTDHFRDLIFFSPHDNVTSNSLQQKEIGRLPQLKTPWKNAGSLQHNAGLSCHSDLQDCGKKK